MRPRRVLVAVLASGLLGLSPSVPAARATPVPMPTSPLDVVTSLRPNPVDAGRALAFGPNGTAFIAGDAGGDFGISRSSQYGTDYWGTDGKVIADFDGRTDAANAVAATGDGGAVAAGTSSGDVAVLEVDDKGYPTVGFGTAGRVLTDLGGADDAAYGVAFLPGGSVLVAGGNSSTAVLLRYRPDGSLDPTFGTGGRASVAAAGPWRAMALQPDGKIAVAGGGNGLVVGRFLADGTADATFGTGGQTRLLAGSGTVAHAVAVGPDGQITVAGGRNGDAAVGRVTATGAPALTFGVAGAVVTDLGGAETAYGVAVGADGVVTVVGEHDATGFAASYLSTGLPNPDMSPTGTVLTDGYDRPAKLRALLWNPAQNVFAIAGSLGADFAQGGLAYSGGHTSIGDGPLDFTAVSQTAAQAVRQSDGKIVVAGDVGGVTALVRSNADGSLDHTYGHDGRAVSDLVSDAHAAALDPAGRVVVAGTYRGRPSVLRFRPDGSLDSGFGSAGSGGRALATGPDGAWVNAVLALPDGKVLVLGSAYALDDVGGWAARFNSDGTPDAGFGSGGVVTGAYPTNSVMGATVRAARQPDGKIVIAGPLRWVTRLNADGSRDAGFGTGGTIDVTDANVRGVALLADGRILVGSVWLGSSWSVVRLTPSGQADPTFQRDAPYGGYNALGQTLVPLADGRILAFNGLTAARFLPGGELDRSFGDDGRLSMQSGVGLTTVDTFVDPDGTVFSAGSGFLGDTNGFALVRNRSGAPGLPAPEAWGWNPLGQLGTGATTDHASPTTVSGLTNVVSVAAGLYHSLALRTDGTVWAWGWNGYGQLGDGTTTDHAMPARVPGLSHVVSISAGLAHSLAVTSDGAVWAWGSNVVGQLGDGTTDDRHVPVRVANLTNGATVAAGAFHSLALTQPGMVFGWGWNGVGQLGDGTSMDRHTPVQALIPPTSLYRPIQAIAAGAFHSLAVDTDGFAFGWGWNANGELGDGTTIDRHLPVPIPTLSNVRGAAGGWMHSLFVLGDGTVRATGWNGVGQLGDGTTIERHTPVAAVGVAAVRSVAAGAHHSLAVGVDGRVRAWGWNALGQLGTGDTTDRWAAVAVSVGPVGAGVVAGGTYHSVAA